MERGDILAVGDVSCCKRSSADNKVRYLEVGAVNRCRTLLDETSASGNRMASASGYELSARVPVCDTRPMCITL